LTSQVAGRPGDLRIALWDLWWFENAIFEGVSPLYTTEIFYPEGVSLAYHSISWVTAAMALPFRALFGAVGGYNLTFLFQTFLCALSMYALARYVTKQNLPAWVAGFVFAFEPFRMTRAMAHPNLAATAFVPLVFLGAIRAWRERRARFAWFSALSLVLVLLTGAHLFIMTFVALAGLFLFEAFREKAFRDRAFWKVNTQFALAVAVLVGPMVLPYVGAMDTVDEAIRSVRRGGSTDLAALFIPDSRLVFGRLVAPSLDVRGEGASIAYLGFFATALAVLALIGRTTRREVLPWLSLFTCFLVLSLGGELRFAGRASGIALPHAWLDDFRWIQVIRAPERFNLVARAFFAVSVAFGVASFCKVLGRRDRFALLLLPLLGLDYSMLPYPGFPWREPEFYRALAKRGGSGAIVELPLDRANGKAAMLSQTMHGRPLVGGMVARTPRAAFAYVDRSTLLRTLAGRGRKKSEACDPKRLRRELLQLEADGIEYFVVRKANASRKQRAEYVEILGEHPRISNSRIDVYLVRDLLEAQGPFCGSLATSDSRKSTRPK
jgi:hypothetical protein